MRRRSRTAPARSRRAAAVTRRVLVVAQVGASVALVACAGLLVRSFDRLQRVPPGVDPENVITFRVDLPGLKYDTDEKGIDFFERLSERLRALPGVTRPAGRRAAARGPGWTGDLFIEGRPEVWGRDLRHKTIVPGYFAAIGLPLVRGRDLAASDTASAPAVVVVNETLARIYFENADPIGRRIAFVNPQRSPDVGWRTIVGVVRDEKQDGLGIPVAPRCTIPSSEFRVRPGDGGPCSGCRPKRSSRRCGSRCERLSPRSRCTTFGRSRRWLRNQWRANGSPRGS